MSTIEFRSHMTVELIDSMAHDEAVIRAAKVSTLGQMVEQAMVDHPVNADPDKNQGFINYLMSNRHGSPFEHAVFTFFVHAPIFVWREMMRHRIASYNEESGRYKQLQPVFYIPNDDRDLVQTGKPGHYKFESGSVDQLNLMQSFHMGTAQIAYENYQTMLDAGIAREVARMTLPLNIYSSAYITINARSLMNMLSLRTKRLVSTYPSFPQAEIEMVADGMEYFFEEKMPLTSITFNKNGRVAP